MNGDLGYFSIENKDISFKLEGSFYLDSADAPVSFRTEFDALISNNEVLQRARMRYDRAYDLLFTKGDATLEKMNASSRKRLASKAVELCEAATCTGEEKFVATYLSAHAKILLGEEYDSIKGLIASLDLSDNPYLQRGVLEELAGFLLGGLEVFCQGRPANISRWDLFYAPQFCEQALAIDVPFASPQSAARLLVYTAGINFYNAMMVLFTNYENYNEVLRNSQTEEDRVTGRKMLGIAEFRLAVADTLFTQGKLFAEKEGIPNVVKEMHVQCYKNIVNARKEVVTIRRQSKL